MAYHLFWLLIIGSLTAPCSVQAQNADGMTKGLSRPIDSRSSVGVERDRVVEPASFSSVAQSNYAPSAPELPSLSGLTSASVDSTVSRGIKTLPFAALFKVDGKVLVARRRLNLMGQIQVDAGARLWGNQMGCPNLLRWQGLRLAVEVVDDIYYVQGLAW